MKETEARVVSEVVSKAISEKVSRKANEKAGKESTGEAEELMGEPEFVQSKEEIDAISSSEEALVVYQPKSRAPFQLGTLVPRNMAFEMQKALSRLVKLKGNIDNYVMRELKYATSAEMWKALAAEQVDSIGLYLLQFEGEQGMIIADQTGIGKGRQAAAVIRHSVLNGYLPVFFTRKGDLFTDLYRDLKNIGFGDIRPFIVNTDNHSRVKDADGHVVFSPLSSTDQYDLICQKRTVPTDSEESVQWHKKKKLSLPDPKEVPEVTIIDELDHLPEDYNAVFCTYSQIQAAAAYKRDFLEKLVLNGIEGSRKYKRVVFVMDESHMAGGFDSIIGKWMREVLPLTKAACYLSATFSKYPEVMPFYAKKTAISEVGVSDEKFVDAMYRGGLALQEIMAANLVESGQLVRRQRSSEGIKVEYITLNEEPERSKNRQRVNRITRLMNMVVDFEQEYILPILNDVHAKAKSLGEQLESSPRSLGVKQAPYFSRVFSVIDQLLFSLKVSEVAKKAVELLNEDKKVVIAFKSTMGSFLKDLNLMSGDRVEKEQLDFARTLIKGLDSVFNYNYTHIDGNKSRMRIELSELPHSGVLRYEEIKQLMLEESTGLGISPIDELIDLIEKHPRDKKLGGHKGEYFRVSEVTGRNQRLLLEEGGAIVRAFRSDTEKSFRLFNEGEYDVLLINQSGSTGSSAHASKDFKDQRQRTMLIHQFELDINTEVQKRGRIDRTGQVNLPEYYYMTSDIPMEMRLMFMLKAKLKSLDANTTGSQKTSEGTLKSSDFLNKYGDKVAWNWVDNNKGLVKRMGWPTYHKETDKFGYVSMVRNESKEGAIKQLTGRAGLLTVEEQEKLYNDLFEGYQHQIIYEKQQGTYDLETEFLKLDAKIEKRFIHQKGKGGKTPFGKDTIREICIVNNLKRPMTRAEVDKTIASALKGKKPAQLQMELLSELNELYPEMIEKRKKKREVTIEKLKEELEGLRGLETEDEKERARIDRDILRVKELIEQKREALQHFLNDLEMAKSTLLRFLGAWKIGEVVKVPLSGLMSYWGIFLGIRIGKAKNRYQLSNVSLKFAVIDSRRLVEYNLSYEQLKEINGIYALKDEISEQDKERIPREWNELVKSASLRREKRHILTGNIIGATGFISTRDKLIKYNTDEGVIKNGIFMRRNFGENERDTLSLRPISEAINILRNLETDRFYSDNQNRVRFKRIDERTFALFITKKGNYQLHTSKELRSLIKPEEGQGEDELPDFVQNAGDMTAKLDMSNLERFLDRLDGFGLFYLAVAEELEDWEEENLKDWEKETRVNTVFRYRLSRAYGEGSNPTSSFINYIEPNADYAFGVVEYSRALTDSEKYNYSLIPIFNRVEEPYQQWKAYLKESGLKSDYKELLNKIKHKQIPINSSIDKLGAFIEYNPHEDGNHEFVFGDFYRKDLGKAAYEDEFGVITPVDRLIDQLRVMSTLKKHPMKLVY